MIGPETYLQAVASRCERYLCEHGVHTPTTDDVWLAFGLVPAPAGVAHMDPTPSEVAAVRALIRAARREGVA